MFILVTDKIQARSLELSVAYVKCVPRFLYCTELNPNTCCFKHKVSHFVKRTNYRYPLDADTEGKLYLLA